MKARKPRIPKPGHPARPAVPALEWLGDVSGRAARATAIGSERMLIENHTGIKAFTDEQVLLATPGGVLGIFGSGLTLNEVRPRTLIVRGCIRRVDLPEDGGMR